jgi:hypothetical protein
MNMVRWFNYFYGDGELVMDQAEVERFEEVEDSMTAWMDEFE